MTTDEARQLADDVAILNGRRRGDIVRVLREQADEIDRLRAALLEIWQLTNLPFTDTDRHEIQALALRAQRALTEQEDGDG